ncbi:MAG TPA: hypothetical protein VKA30_05175 [Actinomycetota bacterium]|nr:hypothetical protein [Actinomycetota bacterium]
MALDERARHDLHAKLEQVLGPNEAGTLMSYLPPVGWADVATKRDLDQLASKVDLERFRADISREIHAEVRSLMVFVSSLFIALAGIAFAAARLT